MHATDVKRRPRSGEITSPQILWNVAHGRVDRQPYQGVNAALNITFHKQATHHT